jgi:prepilin-type N-terminal cleavage/methylation domain-containing protein
MQRAVRQEGFTLIEMMIVVAIIGILAGVAVPGFFSYQSKARRTEAFVNVTGLVRSQRGFQAERDAFYEVAVPMPDWDSYGGLGTNKMPWDGASQTAFDELGWEPEGQVFYGYGINTGTAEACDAACGPAATSVCFTASAMGDVDGDGLASEVMYVEPATDQGGGVLGECPSVLNAQTPLQPGSLQPIYKEVAVNFGTDEF